MFLLENFVHTIETIQFITHNDSDSKHSVSQSISVITRQHVQMKQTQNPGCHEVTGFNKDVARNISDSLSICFLPNFGCLVLKKLLLVKFSKPHYNQCDPIKLEFKKLGFKALEGPTVVGEYYLQVCEFCSCCNSVKP